MTLGFVARRGSHRRMTEASDAQPFITLAQFLKARGLAQTGGQAKLMAREAGIVVNGAPENRPGRKLHDGDVVVLDGNTLTVQDVRPA